MTYVEQLRPLNDTRMYVIQLRQDRVTAFVSDKGSALKLGDTALDKELTDLVVEEFLEGLEGASEQVRERANDILEGLGYQGLELQASIVPLSKDNNEYARVRHYTTSARAQSIAESRMFGGAKAPRPMDQGRVFVELAKATVLSKQQFVERYAITNGNLGEAYVEFMVPVNELETQVCSRNGKLEYTLRANGVEDGKSTYSIKSEVKVIKR